MKKFVHFNHASDFAKKKVSASADNTTYRMGGVGEVKSGTPDIKFSQIVFIKDTRQEYTHGAFYDFVTKESFENRMSEVGKRIDEIEQVITDNELVVSATLNYLNDKVEEKVSKEELQGLGGVIPVTYKELVSLRDNGELKAGAWYRMTDYECTTVQENTRSAGHRFDLLIFAIDEKTLSEECKACVNEEYENVLTAWGEELEYKGEVLVHFLDGDAIAKRFFNDEEDQFVVVGDCYIGGVCSVEVIDNHDGTITLDGYDLPTENILQTPNISLGYFSNSHLEAWKVWYCLDNDKNRFDWAASDGILSNSMGGVYRYVNPITINGVTYYKWGLLGDVIYTKVRNPNKDVDHFYCIIDGALFDMVDDGEDFSDYINAGKGVIYRLIDEHRNDVPYDFKNIQFKRWYGVCENEIIDTLEGTYCIADIDNRPRNIICEEESDYTWLYTFSLHCNGMELSDLDKNDEIFDETVFIANNKVCSDEGLEEECRDNVFKPYYGGYHYEDYNHEEGFDYQGQIQRLNNNTFLLGCEDTGNGKFYSDYAYGIYGNSFGVDCHDNSIGSSFNDNSIGGGFNFNSIGSSFNDNSIGNVFGHNSIGSSFFYNSIGGDFNFNSIGSSFGYNSIGRGFGQNSIGSSFHSNSIGNSFFSNSIGSSFFNNSIGSSVDYNSIGINVKNITINDGVVYVDVTGGANWKDSVLNCHIFNGVKGSRTNRLVISFQRNKNYTQFAALGEDETLKIWTM